MDNLKKRILGNSCIYCLFSFVNIFLFTLGLGLLGAAIYIFVLTESANAFDLLFLGLGVGIMINTIFAWCSRASVAGLNIYLFILTLLLLAQITVTAIFGSNKTYVVNLANKHKPDNKDVTKYLDELKKHYDILLYCLIAITVLIVY